MKTYPVEIDASQIVRWLLEEQRRGTLSFAVRATRSYIVDSMQGAERRRLGEEEMAELSDVLAVGILEVRPPLASNGWLLQVRVEDVVVPRLPEDESAPDGEEEIDLDAFEAEFIAPGSGMADVTLEVESPEAKARFTRVFRDMLRDQHRQPSKRTRRAASA